MESQRKIFFACNYNDKKIKSRFDNLKERLEKKFPITCVLLDKQKKKHAKDIWKEIREEIQASSTLFFDVSGFRPNVIIELGYALAIKNQEQLFLTYDDRKKRRKKKQNWLLSDIPHLNRKDYKKVEDLEKFINEQLKQTTYYKKIKHFNDECQEASFNKNNKLKRDKFKKVGNKIMQVIRDEGAKSHIQLNNLAQKEGCRLNSVLNILRKAQLVKKRGGKGKIYELRND